MLSLDMMREVVTPANARNWCGRVLGFLSKRDQDDLTRLEVKIGQKGLIRYLVGQDHDPIFCGSREEKVYQKFAATVEAAYHQLVTDLAAAREEDKAAKARAFSGE